MRFVALVWVWFTESREKSEGGVVQAQYLDNHEAALRDDNKTVPVASHIIDHQGLLGSSRLLFLSNDP